MSWSEKKVFSKDWRKTMILRWMGLHLNTSGRRRVYLSNQHRIKKSTAESRPRKFDKDKTERMGRMDLIHQWLLTKGEVHWCKVDGDKQIKKMRLRSRPLSLERASKILLTKRRLSRLLKVEAKTGEADRVIPTLKPKHLLSGKQIGVSEIEVIFAHQDKLTHIILFFLLLVILSFSDTIFTGLYCMLMRG